MTLLSQSLELLRRARALLHEVEVAESGAAAAPESPAGFAESAAMAGSSAEEEQADRAAAAPPCLRLVSAASASQSGCGDRDMPITGVAPYLPQVPRPLAPSPVAPGAHAFLAGTGARLYSLDAWRREHPPRGRTPHAA